MSGAEMKRGLLAGRVIAVPETRELDRLASILEQDGATTLRCPLVAILDAPDPAPVDAWLKLLAAGAFDDLLFLTGEGLRRLLDRARITGIYDEVHRGLAAARKITRGPKPARALHEVQLATDLAATVPTSQGVMQALAEENLHGHHIGVQLYGSEPNLPLVTFLTGAGATVTPVSPYIYAPGSDTARVLDLITRLEEGSVDVIAFTSASQVDRLWNVAQDCQREPGLRAGLKRVKVAAVGPIVVEALEDRGIPIGIVPEQPFIMKRLSAAIVDALTIRPD